MFHSYRSWTAALVTSSRPVPMWENGNRGAVLDRDSTTLPASPTFRPSSIRAPFQHWFVAEIRQGYWNVVFFLQPPAPSQLALCDVYPSRMKYGLVIPKATQEA